MTVREARADEVAAAAGILDEATAFVATKGFPQWPSPFPVAQLEGNRQRGELYVVEVGDEIAAAFVLLWEDVPFWGERAPDAAYLHKLAVRRRFAGRGLGTGIVRWAEQRAAEAGRRFLRLDCYRDNPTICAYYERLGFMRRGERDLGSWIAALYEREVA